MDNLEYLSDEALLALIEISEEDGLLHAPSEMKQEVLTRAEHDTRQYRERERRRQFISYCVKVTAGVAAALIFVFGANPAAQKASQRHETAEANYVFYEANKSVREFWQDVGEHLDPSNLPISFGGNNHAE